MTLQEGKLKFDFTGVVNAFKFDEEDRALSTFHGLSHCMKSVDFIAEYENHYVFIEIKDPPDPTCFATERNIADLVKNIVIKFRDTFIYRWAEKKLDKPVYYQCLIELDDALTLIIMEQLKNNLPMKEHFPRWKRSLVHKCVVANLETWNRTFPNIQVTRVT